MLASLALAAPKVLVYVTSYHDLEPHRRCIERPKDLEPQLCCIERPQGFGLAAPKVRVLNL